MSKLSDLKPEVSVRLRTFRGQKKPCGDADIGRYCWDKLQRLAETTAGPCSDKVAELVSLWMRVKALEALPLEIDMTTAKVKETRYQSKRPLS